MTDTLPMPVMEADALAAHIAETCKDEVPGKLQHAAHEASQAPTDERKESNTAEPFVDPPLVPEEAIQSDLRVHVDATGPCMECSLAGRGTQDDGGSPPSA